MRTILAIAASQDLQQLLQRVFGKTDALILCSCPEEAAAHLQREIDALIIELSLPDCIGLEFLESCHRWLPPVVLALTPVVSPSVMAEAAAAGVTCMIRLPCTAREIAARLETGIKKIPPFREGKDCQKVTPYE